MRFNTWPQVESLSVWDSVRSSFLLVPTSGCKASAWKCCLRGACLLPQTFCQLDHRTEWDVLFPAGSRAREGTASSPQGGCCFLALAGGWDGEC